MPPNTQSIVPSPESLPSTQVRILLSASGYNDDDKKQKKIRDQSRKILSKGTSVNQWVHGVSKALRYSKPIWSPAQQFLHNNISDLVKHTGINVNLTFGVYAGTFEPSFCYEQVVRRDSVPGIIRSLAKFGNKFRQKEVYLLEYLPHNFKKSQADTIPASASLEMAWLVSFGELVRPTEVMKVASKLGVPGLTMMSVGHQFLFYTIGTQRGEIPQFPMCFEQLRSSLSNRPRSGEKGRQGDLLGVVPDSEKKWYILLHRIGNKRNGALVSYRKAMQSPRLRTKRSLD